MNTINGRVQHSTSKSPLKDLIVIAYDFDFSKISSQYENIDEKIIASFFFSVGNNNDVKEDSNIPGSPSGDRLGSTITDAKGNFQFSFEDSDFQRQDEELRPDLVLFVLAPDFASKDKGFLGTPEYFRILHMTFYPVRNAGRSEALIINISDEQLSKFGLTPSQPNVDQKELVVETIKESYKTTSSIDQDIKNNIRSNISENKKKTEKAASIVANLSTLPKSFRENQPLFINRKDLNSDSLKNKQEIAGKKGVQNVALQTLNNPGRKPKQFMNLGRDWLERIINDNDRIDAIMDAIRNGETVEDIPIDYGTFCVMQYSKNKGTILRRNSNPIKLRKDRDDVIAKLRAIENGETGEDEVDESEDEGRRQGTPWEEGESKEEYIKRLVVSQVQELSNEVDVNILEDENSDVIKKQVKKIKVSLEELTPPVGPADVTAYYEFNTLQIAYPNVWTEAFDGNVEKLMEEMLIAYEGAYEVYREGAGDILDRLADFPESEEELYDLNSYTKLMGLLSDDIKAFGPPHIPPVVLRVFAGGDVITPMHPKRRSFFRRSFFQRSEQVFAGGDDITPMHYSNLSIGQQTELLQLAIDYETIKSQEIKNPEADEDFGAGAFLTKKFEDKNLNTEDIPHIIELFKSKTKRKTNETIDLVQEQTNKLAEIEAQGRGILSNPKGAGTKAQRIMAELAERLKHPHSFRIYAENSYNFGIITTLQQEWVKMDYQTTNLVSTMTLAPGEKITYVKKENLKKSVSRKELEKNSSTLNDERTYSSKATSDVAEKITKNTNFAVTHSSQGSGGISGIFNIQAQTGLEFKRDQAAESQKNRQAVKEATRKAAQEYKNERSLEVTTDSSSEFETSYTSEISNPNNEITVTYLFYELERQYKVTEHLEKVTPVILVAQRVPAPHEIDEDWILAYEWILRRSMLDRDFLNALDFISEGLIGDEVALEVLKENYETQKNLVDELTTTVSALTQMQETLRDTLIQTSEREKIAEVEQKRRKKKRRRGIVRKIFNPARAIADRIASGASGLSFGNEDPALLEARREALETRLEYLDSNLADQQSQLAASNSALTKVAEDFEAAIKESFTKKNLVTQLKIHIKDNILYYMQTLWSYEYEHQRYMRLYNLPVEVPAPGSAPTSAEETIIGSIDVSPIPDSVKRGLYGSTNRFGDLEHLTGITINMPTNSEGEAEYHIVSKRLHEIADVDNMMGFKGNYMIFPLKECTFITDYMMQDYVDEYMGVRSPDPVHDYSTDELLKLAEEVWHHEDTTEGQHEALRQLILDRLNSPVLDDDLIVLPTGQLYIEALKGSHALLEDFKLKHRKMDMLKVKEEVRAEQLENLRKALRLVNETGSILDDPDVDKKVIVEGGGDITVSD